MKALVVTKKSTFAQMSEDPRMKKLLKKPVLRRARAVHDRHLQTLAQLEKLLKQEGIRPWYINGAGVAFDASNADIVITVGGDGTLLSASHYVGPGTPILGINSDPATSIGHFCALNGITSSLRKVLKKPKTLKVTRMEVLVRGKSIAKRVLNEALFSHACPAATSRFSLGTKQRTYPYKCSGAWIGTGAGSTGALLSAGGEPFSMASKSLLAVIRESYVPDRHRAKPTIFRGSELKVVNQMTEATLYLDGPFLQAPVGLGDTVTFRVSREPLTLVG